MVLHCANVGAILIVSNPKNHECTRHIEVDDHFIMEKVTDKDT